MIFGQFSAYSRKAALAAVTVLGLALAQPILVAPAAARDAPESFADLVDKLMPTVVNITTTQNVPQQGQRLRDIRSLVWSLALRHARNSPALHDSPFCAREASRFLCAASTNRASGIT